MPSRNIIRRDAERSYYHVYARGASKQPIFLEPKDFYYFENLFARYLSMEATKDKMGVVYPHFSGEIELVAYCLIPNHFHLLVYQIERGALSKLMRGVMTSYSRYFNLKYKRSGSLFENRYKAALIDDESYLMHISRYIHLNPRYWKSYQYSSLPHYKKMPEEWPEWLAPRKVLDMFPDLPAYLKFLRDYEDNKHILEAVKKHLAE
jgi:putative transposase